jgi:hypothetical protein
VDVGATRKDLRAWLGHHPWWVGAVFLFCLYMTFVYMPFDIFAKLFFQEIAEAEEVWFGILLRGSAAKATEPLHWLIYGGLAWGFFKQRSWVWPAAALYAVQVAIGMLVWNVREESGMGWPGGLVAFALFVALAVALWRYGSRAPSSAPA